MGEQSTIPDAERKIAAQPVVRAHDSGRLILRSLHRIEGLLALLVARTEPAVPPAPVVAEPKKRKKRKPVKRTTRGG